LNLEYIQNRLTRGKGILYYNDKRKYFVAKINGRIVNQWSLRHMNDMLHKLLGKSVSTVESETDKQGRITKITIIFYDDKHFCNKQN
jgi:uncharacterized protein YbcI